jgi:hypothetical protein
MAGFENLLALSKVMANDVFDEGTKVYKLKEDQTWPR